MSAAFISSVGDRMTYVVLPFLLFGLHFSAAEVALILGARAVGYGIVVLFGGVAADRIDGWRIMASSDAVRAVTQLATLVCVVSAAGWIPVFIGLQLVYGLAEGSFRPAARRIIPTVVEQEHLERANGLYSAVTTSGLLIGPAIAAVFAGLSMSSLALALDAASFLVSGWTLARLSRRPTTIRFRSGSSSVLSDIRAGWNVVLRTPWLRLVILTSTIFHATALSAVYSLGPAYAQSTWNGAATWGVLVTVFGVGGLCGGFVATRIQTRRPILVLLFALLVLAAQPMFLTSGLPIAVVGSLQFVAGVALSVFGVMQETAEQRGLSGSILGRASSVDLFATTISMPIGYVVSAQLVKAIGLEPALQVLGAVGVIACLVALTAPAARRIIRPQFDDDHVDEAAGLS